MATNILVPIDFSDVTGAVLAEATHLARATSARIWLMHVTPPDSGYVAGGIGVPVVVPGAEVHAERVQEDRQKLTGHEKALRDDDLDVTAIHTEGNPAEKILEEADQKHADTIVLGSHGHGALYHLLLGGATEAVIRHATCPVLIVPARPKPD